MKTLVFGDIHGRDIWKEILDSAEYDNCIFLGDYVDTHDKITHKQQLSNFKKLMEYKEKLGDRMILLLGNHDYHYWTNNHNIRYSGFNSDMKYHYGPLIRKAVREGKVRIAYIQDGFLFTHAGVSKTWLEKYSDGLKSVKELTAERPNVNMSTLDFNMAEGYEPYGDTIGNGPLWIRPYSLSKDMVDGYDQIVGHTPAKAITNIKDVYEGTKHNLWLCDNLEKEYVVIEDGVVSVKEVPVKQPDLTFG